MRKCETEKADWRAASICHEINRAMTGKADKMEKYLVVFEEPKVKVPDPTGQSSKAAWAAMLGITLEPRK